MKQKPKLKVLALTILFVAITTAISCNEEDPEPIVITIADFSETMDENPTSGSIGTVQASTNRGEIVYSLSNEDPSGAMSINASTGELLVRDRGLFDYESRTSITATVVATVEDVSEEASVVITLNDLDDAMVSIEDATFSIAENPAANSEIGVVIGTSDQGDVTYSILSQEPEGAIAVDEVSGSVTVADASIFDFEVHQTVTATIRAAFGSISADATVTINITDLTEIVAEDFETTIPEAPEEGTVLGTVDIDVQEGVELSYSISSEEYEGSLAINDQGQLSVLERNHFDFETDPEVTATVRVTGGGLTAQLNVVITLTDRAGLLFERITDDAPWGNRTSATITEFDNKLWFIGGFGSALTRGIYSSFDGITWQQMTADDDDVANRNGHMTIVYNDSLRVMSGSNQSSGRWQDVRSSLNGEQWVLDFDNVPSTRWGAQAIVFDGQAWIIGGHFLGSGPFPTREWYNDIWRSNDGINWTQEVAEAVFGQRAGHQIVEFNGRLIMTGGNRQSTYYDDVWESTNGTAWTEVNTNGTFPRVGFHQMVVYNGKIYSIGGHTGTLSPKQDVIVSEDGVTWTNAEMVGDEYLGRVSHSAIVFDGSIWLFGGSISASDRPADIWRVTEL